jgi:hypothetical protein
LSPQLTTISNEKVYNTLFYLKTELPLKILEKISELPYFGNESKRE